MPKVTKQRQEMPLQEVAPMAVEAGVEEAEAGAGPVPKPQFAPLSAYEQNGKRIEFRRIPVPQHRMTPLKNSWLTLYKPITENMKLDMRMNLKTKKASAVACGMWEGIAPRPRPPRRE